MARVKATKYCDENYQRVLEGSVGELQEMSQDGLKVTVRWDWALKAEQSANFLPVQNLVVEVEADAVVAIEG
jgi:hypothetical protein